MHTYTTVGTKWVPLSLSVVHLVYRPSANASKTYFLPKPSHLLNQDKTITCGATFACTMLPPVFRVCDFHIGDINHYPIKTQWTASPSDPNDGGYF